MRMAVFFYVLVIPKEGRRPDEEFLRPLFNDRPRWKAFPPSLPNSHQSLNQSKPEIPYPCSMKPITLFASIAMLLTACAPAAQSVASPQQSEPTMIQSTPTPIPELGVAPELHDGVWLNTEQPLKLADLRGQVVLLEMWTFGCINCQRVIPHVREWYETYKDQGLTVIGNHYPEFEYEADLANLEQAIAELNVPYPVLQDNDRETWSAYRNRYWPTTYLIDKQGVIRYVHIGEGHYAETEAAIQALLAEPYPG
jgi:thiol-disulfide isomerase/thioredoxin